MKILITVPTYWRPQQEDAVGIYDHPTPIGEKGTLPGLLDSLISVDPAVPVAVIAAVTGKEVEDAAERQLQDVIAPYRGKLTVALFSGSDMRFIASRLSTLGYEEEGIGLVGYGNVRNLQLTVGSMLGVDALIGLDDDEQVPISYFQQVRRHIGKEFAGERILGMAGPYREESNLPAHNANPLLARGEWIARAISALEPSDELAETPIGFGGNIVLHRDLFTNVPFDSRIPRGEDIDYITTCRMVGYKFWWNKGLFVDHFPPVRLRRPACKMLQRDIARFIYSREKLAKAALLGLTVPKNLEPYPGRFLREDLVGLSLSALDEVCPEEGSAREFVEETISSARAEAGKYFTFQYSWKGLMGRIAADKQLKDYAEQKFNTQWRKLWQ